MKVAIITIIDYINYGNRLQNYAVQEVLKEMDCDVETIVAVSPKRKMLNAAKFLLRKIAPGVIYRHRPYIMRETVLSAFTKRYIKECHMVVRRGQIPKSISKRYDAFVVGSDQVWNPQFINLDVPNGGKYNRFLEFVEAKPKIAYAPSIAVNSIEDKDREDYKKGIEDLTGLSVRENSGASIIYELTGRNAEVLIDPTLMLDAEAWRKLCMEEDKIEKEPYILEYILGDKTEETCEWIDNLASGKKLKIRKMMTMEDPELYSVSPEVFIKAIDDAALICTDSFHATVFSILLNKPFVIIPRSDSLQSMSSRIETLISTLKVKNRDYRMLDETEVFECDYESAYDILLREREKVKTYLKKTLYEGA